MTVAAGSLVVLTALDLAVGRRTPADQMRNTALVMASLALTAQVAEWHLIGWGLK